MRWLIEHASDLLSKYQVGEDGKTRYQRLKGRSTGAMKWSSVRRCTTASKRELDKKSWSPDELKASTWVNCGAQERRSSAPRVAFTNLGRFAELEDIDVGMQRG